LSGPGRKRHGRPLRAPANLSDRVLTHKSPPLAFVIRPLVFSAPALLARRGGSAYLSRSDVTVLYQGRFWIRIFYRPTFTWSKRAALRRPRVAWAFPAARRANISPIWKPISARGFCSARPALCG